MTNTTTETGEGGGNSNAPNRPSWSRMGREGPVEPVRSMRPAPGTGALSRLNETAAARRSMSVESTSNELESLDPSLEALRMIRDSLNYNSIGDHHTFFVMGASVSRRKVQLQNNLI